MVKRRLVSEVFRREHIGEMFRVERFVGAILYVQKCMKLNGLSRLAKMA